MGEISDEMAEKLASKLRLRFATEFLMRKNLGEKAEDIFADLAKSLKDGSFHKEFFESLPHYNK